MFWRIGMHPDPRPDASAGDSRGRKSWADEDEELPPIDCCAFVCHGLSCLSWTFLALLAGICVVIAAHDARDAALLPGFFVAPLIVLYVFYWRPLRSQISLDLVLKSFAFGFLPGACIVMLVELVLAGFFFVVCFHDQLGGWFAVASSNAGDGGLRALPVTGTQQLGLSSLLIAMHSAGRDLRSRETLPAGRGVGSTAARRVASHSGEGAQDPLKSLGRQFGISVTRTPGLYLFIFLLAYVVAAGTEEMLKYLTPLRFRACTHSACPYVYLVCALACALGFATVENMGYTFQARHDGAPFASGNSTTAAGAGEGEGEAAAFAARAYTAYSRAVVAIMAHGLFGGLVGLGLTRRHVVGLPLRWWQILAPAVLAHGSFDFQQMLLALEVWEEGLQGGLALALDGGLLLACAGYLWRQVRALPLLRDGETPMCQRGGVTGDDVALLSANAGLEGDGVRLLQGEQALP